MSHKQRFIYLTIIFSTWSSSVFSQSTDSLSERRKIVRTSIVVGTAYAGSMVVLGHAWYADAPKSSFHFFNDLPEWKQMDKAGHMFSAFHVADNASALYRSCGLTRQKSDVVGVVAGALILSSIEVFDGFSSAYGASVSDIAANLTGTLFYWGQSWRWHEVRIHPKFSFHRTSFARDRPDVLGSGISEVLKDYNGQTYWWSIDVGKFSPNSNWPKWLGVSVGYGANGMLYARDGQNTAAGYQPYRQYYLSLDVDLTSIPTRSKFLKGVFKALNTIKVPAPTLEFSKRGIEGHWIYF